MILAVVWHWWIGVFLAIGAVVALLGTIIGYLVKVQSPRYPRR
jgi:hypothetical protein